MARTNKNKRKVPKKALALPDLQQSKTALLTTLTSACARRTYNHAIDEFVEWYCSEPRLAFNLPIMDINARMTQSSGNFRVDDPRLIQLFQLYYVNRAIDGRCRGVLACDEAGRVLGLKRGCANEQ